jgi:hypothetical protein
LTSALGVLTISVTDAIWNTSGNSPVDNEPLNSYNQKRHDLIGDDLEPTNRKLVSVETCVGKLLDETYMTSSIPTVKTLVKAMHPWRRLAE